MKLELKHLTSYLPYGLKVSNQFGVFELLGLRNKSNTNNNIMLSYKLHSDIVWGLIVRYEKVKYTVSFLYSLKNHLNHWDNLILTKQHIK